MQARTRLTVWFLMAVALSVVCPALANNIRVANVGAVQQDVAEQKTYVAFDLSWENSWRNDINWDAAWVFVKFRPEGSNDWEHAHLSTNSADHVSAAGSVIAPVPDGRGVFVYRDSDGTGPVNYANTRLLWQYGSNGYAFARGDQIELSVHAIEMVYVKEGAFYVGSGGTESGSFTDGSWPGSGATIPLAITSENAQAIGQSAGALWGTSSSGDNTIGGTGTLPAAFPKGFAAFYCMKYQITQGQYAEYLNLLTSAQKTARFPNSYASNRHTIQLVEGVYVAERPDRACNFLSWLDGASYAAWAGLRPVTEMEFEKACRGPEYPVSNEYPWGTNSVMGSAKVLGGAEDGTETLTSSATAGGAHYGTPTITGGDGGQGPLRVGIFATNGATRVTAGASYWGIMELSGNLWERPVSVGHATGRNFQGSHGTGTLDLPSDWPGTNAQGTGFRGGAWNFTTVDLRVSDRTYAAHVNAERLGNRGFRAVRSAPSGVGD